MNRVKRSVGNLEKYMKMWNKLLSFSGVSPVVSQLGRKGELEYRSSLAMMVISVFVVAISVLISYFQSRDHVFDLSNIPKFIITGYLTVFSSLVNTAKGISAICTSKSYAALCNNILRFSRNSSKTRVESVLRLSFKYVSFYLLVMISSFVYDFLILDEDGDFITLDFLLNYVPVFYSFLCICQFAVCCFWVNVSLFDINMEIIKCSTYLLRSIDQGLKVFRFNAVFPESISEISSTVDIDVNRIKHIRRLYHEVYLLSSQVNEVFSTSICITLIDCFFLSTFLMYFGLEEIGRYTSSVSNLTIFEVINYFKYSIMSFLFVYGLIWPSSKVYYQAGVTAELVQEYFTKVPKGELQTEFHGFVIQLHQEEICFSPHGFFFLNNRLILSIIGSVASYLVILIQFRVKVV